MKIIISDAIKGTITNLEASKLYNIMKAHIKHSSPVLLSFKGVLTTNKSFLDNSFGKIITDFGTTDFTKNIFCVEMNVGMGQTINSYLGTKKIKSKVDHVTISNHITPKTNPFMSFVNWADSVIHEGGADGANTHADMKLTDPKGFLGLGKGGLYLAGTTTVVGSILSAGYVGLSALIYHPYSTLASGSIITYLNNQVTMGGASLGNTLHTLPQKIDKVKKIYNKHFNK